MSNEIEIRVSLLVNKANVSLALASGLVRATMSGDDAGLLTQVIGTSEEALFIPADIGTPGYVCIINDDASNFVKVRHATGGTDLVKIPAGTCALFKLASTAPFIIADTGSCRIRYLVVEA